MLSMNAAISSSVVLASRLPDDLSVFGLILFSVQSFALFPILRRRMQVRTAYIFRCALPDFCMVQTTAKLLQVVLTAVISALAVALTHPLSSTAARIYISCFIFVTFIAPGVLVWAQRYKKCVLRHLLSACRI